MSEFFEIQNTLSFNKDRLVPGNEYDYVTRTSNNQGILESTGFINDENLNSSNIWSLGLLQMDFFYRRKPWYAGQFVKKIIPKIDMTPKVTMYFTVVLNKQKEKLLSVLVRDVDEVFNSACVDLPFLNGSINFSYMEKFIEELEAERIEELDAYLMATGLKDYKLTKEDQKILDDFEKMSDNSLDRQTDKIRLGNIFNIESPKKKFNANSIKFDGEYPYVARGETNNGIKGYITEEIDYLNNGNTISFGQDTATMFYQKTPYFTGDKIKILSPKIHSLNSDIALYYITSTKKTLSTFSWGSTSYNVNNLENIIIELPIENNKIDITFMKKFIKVVKKLIIKDVVIWANKKIEATKQVVLKH